MLYSTQKALRNHGNESIPECTVCNEVIPAYAGKLLPFHTSLHTVYKSDGTTIDYQYESSTITIQILKNETWKFDFLNVGKMCFWTQNGQEKLGAIYRYTPVTNPNQSITGVAPLYGSIDNVIAARKTFLTNGGKESDFPYEEITDPMPLDSSGHLLESAITGGAEYLHVTGYDRVGDDWSVYGFPTSI